MPIESPRIAPVAHDDGIRPERLLEFHLTLETRLRGLSDPVRMIEVGTALLGQALGACQVGFGEVDEAGERVLIRRAWSDGRVPEVAGAWCMAAFGPAFAEALHRGEAVVSPDLAEDPRIDDPEVSAAYLRGETRALMVMPLLREDRLAAVLFAQDSAPRPWTATEQALAWATSERLWDSVQRARAEAALRKSREQLTMALEAARIGVFDWDPVTDRIAYTQQSAELFGLRPGDRVRTKEAAFRIVHPDDVDRHREALMQAYVARTEWRDEYRVIRPVDGKVVWIEERGRALVAPRTGKVRMRGVHWEVTARKHAEERLQGALAIKTVGVMYWGEAFRLTEVNDAFLQMTGFTREEAIGKTWQELTPPEFIEASWKAVNEIAERGETTPYEKQYYRKDGSRWWGLFAARRVGDEVVEFVLDVTARREADARLRQLNETLEMRVAEEVAARLSTEEALRQAQKMEAIGQLTGGVAHDFNNLLTVIRSSADLLRRPDLPEERRRRYIEAVAETADRAAKLTGQLLAFARRQALKPEVFNVGTRIEQIAEMLLTVVGSRVELFADTRCDPCFVEADATQFETALVNMAVNARDAMDGAGRLTIKVRPTESVPPVRGQPSVTGPFVAVSVSDTGHGMAEDQVSRIFEPFFTTKEVGKGTGLGLSQVYGFAKQSGGEVDVQTRLGEGSTFTLYLPRVPADPAPEAVVSHAPETAAHRGHVLIVEDNEPVGAFATQLLAELGFETSWAHSGEAALKLLEEAPDRYAAVFSDVVMPGMSGVELAREIQRRGVRTPIVLTSGYSHLLANEGLQGFELLQKPYSADELGRVLGAAIARRLQPAR